MSTTPPLPPAPALLLRYGELTLKGLNQDQFISRLRRNILRQTSTIAPVRVERLYNRMLVFPEQRTEQIARKLQHVFGLKSISPVWIAPPTPEAILPLARSVFLDALESYRATPDVGSRVVTCRVETTRADKRFPIPSNVFDRQVGEHALANVPNIKVHLDAPELTLGIDIRAEGAYLFARRLPGPAGLPVGSSGRGLCLLSGGIDSPVAAWMMMKRGMWMSFVTFHSYPYIGEPSKQKVLALARNLSQWQPNSRTYVVPFSACQEAIRDGAPESYRTVLYRRMMQRIASKLAKAHQLDALVTGESLGQVASQTIENMTCIAAASELPVLRPLVGFDKDDTILLARKIGTFDTSSRQEPDCCTVFMPEKPVIHGDLALCTKFEDALPIDALVDAACAGVELVDFEAE